MSLNIHGEGTLRFELGDLVLADSRDYFVHSLHEFAKFLTHHAEIALDFLLKHVAFDEINGFDVHFVEDELTNGLQTLFQTHIVHRNSDALQRLAHNDALFLAEGEHQRGGLLRQLHAGFEFAVDERFVHRGEAIEVHALGRGLLRAAGQILVQTIGIEGRNRRHQAAEREQAGVERLIGGQFVGCHLTCPVALAV